MMDLQQICFRSAMNFVLLDDERKLEYFDKLEQLVEKQKVFYYRIKLSDDPEAQSVLQTMQQGVIMLGATPGTPIETMFDELINKIHVMRTKLESGTED